MYAKKYVLLISNCPEDCCLVMFHNITNCIYEIATCLNTDLLVIQDIFICGRKKNKEE